MNRLTLSSALVSGAMLVAAFPKWGESYMAWVALIPLFFALENTRKNEAFLFGFITGTVFNTGLLYWITHVTIHYGNLSVFVSVAVMLLFSLYLAIYLGFFAVGIVFLRRRGCPLWISGPLLWTSLEYIKSHVFTGFPWGNLGYVLHDQIPLIQLADITGVYGLSFILVSMNCLLFELLKGGPRKQAVLKALGGVLLMTSVVSYGAWRINYVERHLHKADSLNLAIVQGNIDQSIKWDPEYQRETIAVYKELSEKVAKGDVDCIIWPETAMPFYFQDIDENHRAIVGMVRETGTPLLFGSPSYRIKKGKRYLMNSAWLLDGEGAVVGRYDKVHLVPFGEYVPLRKILFFVDKLVEGFADFTPGESIVPLKLNGLAVGVLICYESIFPEISRNYARNGVDFLVNITNDGWYGRTSAPYQHLSMVPLRAVENRRSVARAANTGISALIDPLGRITAESSLFERTTVSGRLMVLDLETFYALYGDLFALTCLSATGIMLILSLFTRRKAL